MNLIFSITQYKHIMTWVYFFFYNKQNFSWSNLISVNLISAFLRLMSVEITSHKKRPWPEISILYSFDVYVDRCNDRISFNFHIDSSVSWEVKFINKKRS